MLKARLLSLYLLLTSCFFAKAQSTNPLSLGTEHLIHSEVLDEDRSYWVCLPEAYGEPANRHKTYPILVVLDGHAHLKYITGMVNYMSAGYNGNRRIPEMIVVGVKNVNRNRDFTPDKIITKRKNDFGGADPFLQFLEAELIPQLEQAYRTEPFRLLFGHSLGGLLATHAYLKEQTLFNAFIAVDPSFGFWDTPKMDEKLAAVTEESFDRYIYFATANWGKRNFKNRDRHVRLYEGLNSRCTGPFPAKLEYFENENHGSVPPIAFYNGITAIFDGYGLDYREVEDKASLLKHFEALSKRLSYQIHPPEVLVNRMGYRMLRGGTTDKAIEFFTLNTVNFPNSHNAFDSLGEAYAKAGDKKKAMANYQKSLELYPANENARAQLKALKAGGQ
ncbi:MAG TPA: alpha/beta fold hydrolase [Saprospiraceae bacterium]|nr:alpha/beta fold hydrolase [Saprospiraceae bacterium]